MNTSINVKKKTSVFSRSYFKLLYQPFSLHTIRDLSSSSLEIENVDQSEIKGSKDINLGYFHT